MKLFQILNEEVLIINDSITYRDTVANFFIDAGVASAPASCIYDEDQKCCVVVGEFLIYPNATYEGYINTASDLLAKQEARNYVAPAEKTAEEKAAAEKAALKADYDSAVQKLTNSMASALLTGDTAAQDSIRADFADLQTQYKEAYDNV